MESVESDLTLECLEAFRIFHLKSWYAQTFVVMTRAYNFTLG